MAMLSTARVAHRKHSKHTEKQLRLDPESTLTRYGLGYLHWKLYQYDDAERELLEVLRRSPKDPRASFTLGDLYLTRGDATRALPFLEIARAGYPNEFDTRFALGRALVLTGKLEARHRGTPRRRHARRHDRRRTLSTRTRANESRPHEEGKRELQKAQTLHDKQRKEESERFRKKLP